MCSLTAQIYLAVFINSPSLKQHTVAIVVGTLIERTLDSEDSNQKQL